MIEITVNWRWRLKISPLRRYLIESGPKGVIIHQTSYMKTNKPLPCITKSYFCCWNWSIKSVGARLSAYIAGFSFLPPSPDFFSCWLWSPLVSHAGAGLVAMPEALQCCLPLAEEAEPETLPWNKTDVNKKATHPPQSSPGRRARCQWWREGGGEDGTGATSHPRMLALASGISNWHFLKC